MSRSIVAAAAALFVISAIGAPAQAQLTLTAQGADLVPIPSRIVHGAVSIRNAGTAPSQPGVATVVCQPLTRSPCAESPGLAEYTNPAFPNAAVVAIPSIPPGHVHTAYFGFWNGLSWASGNYQFTITADAGGSTGETNEGNNVGQHVMNVP